ncbi:MULTISPECIES: hypothetical protein [Bacillus]|uniref:Uncharacterized protein n=1 Tax=Bacillus cereus VD196 TaxID=1053243 RepID=A0A9W5V9Y6_BACCE|nr:MULTISPECIES: hypothetical protein [Bacillus]CGG05738.1 Uncharacterised protein [Streptococcus pneumoniae]ADH07299.1 hypothetical protein BMB171_C2487 [Bacillus thuringiensis BMB171]ALZ61490.1 hypothetical protein FORC13_2429 [Bacillus cereus]EJR36827.1 hypothetical protein IIE_02213 [Bacillus cereus VD045]EJR98495.1 hypothetical protein IKG_02561 [Bacillus cereus VD200]
MNKVTILLLREQKWTKRDKRLILSTFLLLKDRENLLKQGLEFGTVLAI